MRHIREMMENIKLSMGLYCKACPVCDGRHVKTRYRDRAPKVLVILRSEIIKSGKGRNPREHGYDL